jgi:DNA-binding protein HU-beta
MTKAEIIAEMAEKCKLTKADAERALNSFIEISKRTLKNEGKLAVPGFGSFAVSERKARKGRNPQTGEIIDIQASKGVRFRAGKTLKGIL